MATLPRVPTQNALQYTLDAQLAAGGATATLNQSVAGVVRAPGYVVIDRVDSSGEETASKREYISFTGVSGADLTGLARGLASSTDQVHAVGAVVEIVPDVLYEQDWYDWGIAEHTTTGVHASLPSVTYIKAVNYNGSGASLTGMSPITPVWKINAAQSLASAQAGSAINMPRPGTIEWASVVLSSPVSSASLLIDINKNFTSIFEAGTRLSILGGGTFASTASLNTKIFAESDVFTVDVDAVGNKIDATVILNAR